MTSHAFMEGLTRLGLALGRELTEATMEVYFDAIRDVTDDASWSKFTRKAVSAGTWQFFPTVTEILDELNVYLGGTPLMVEATTAYQRVADPDDGAEYAPESGAVWSFRRIKERIGSAAADAYLAAGGHHAFATGFGEDKRRASFVREYIRCAREDPKARLHAAPRLLEAQRAPATDPTGAEVKAMFGGSRVTEAARVVEVTDARVARLKAALEESGE